MPANNDPLTFWHDRSGNQCHLISPTTEGATTPVFKDNITDNINGLPVVRVASGQGMDIPVGTVSPAKLVAGLSVYLLCRYTIAQADQGPCFIPFEATVPGHQIRVYLDVDQDLFGPGDPPGPAVGWESTTDGFNQIYGLAPAVSGTQVLAAVFDAVAGTGKFYRNGSLLTLSRNDGIHVQSIAFGGDFIEFFNQDNSTYCVGDFVEQFAYGVAHDAATVLARSAYLQSRGGI
jgi:hypothetical protein